MDTLRIAGGQIDLTVGDITGNEAKIVEAMTWAETVAADVLVLPELTITGYPPDDLLLRSAFVEENRAVLARLAQRSGETVVIVGFVDSATEDSPRLDDAEPREVANAAALICRGEVKGIYHKVLLPNYGVFDEDRYFVPGNGDTQLWNVGGLAVGLSVCEDIWVADGPPAAQAEAGAQVLFNINGSPYHRGKGRVRSELLSRQAKNFGVPVVYVNRVGGQDELVFDGQSMVFDAEGQLIMRAAQFDEELFCFDLELGAAASIGEEVRSEARTDRSGDRAATIAPELGETEEAYRALVTGLDHYVSKNGFAEVVIGLSGGIDSALTATVAVDALGPSSVWCVAMPGPYSSDMSLRDAQDICERLGCRLSVIPIGDIFKAHLDALADAFAGTETGIAEENLQARIRGAILMALSNKFGGMVVATGNKSEMAVGYATLYGDMAGGYSVLKDVLKTEVYELARWRNEQSKGLGEPIPQSVIDRPPSAELREDQVDTDSLPPYDQLDPILRRYVEHDESVDAIVAGGADADMVRRVVAMVDGNEYKRRQAAPGVRITLKAFGKDRRLAITRRDMRRD